MFAIEPRSDDCGNEKLGTVAIKLSFSRGSHNRDDVGGSAHLRVWASVCHGEQASLGVLQFEVLIRELLTIDGFASSSLSFVTSVNAADNDANIVVAYIAAGEVTSLKHEIRNHAVEF